MIGHLIPVASETGWSDGDVGYNDAYILARYRIFLSEAEYKRILPEIRRMAAGAPLWHAALYNCNKFVGDVARSMGLQAPFHWIMPKDFVNGIKEMNGGRQELSPSGNEGRSQATASAENRSRPKPTAAAQAGEERVQTTATVPSRERPKPRAAAATAGQTASATAAPSVHPSYAAVQ